MMCSRLRLRHGTGAGGSGAILCLPFAIIVSAVAVAGAEEIFRESFDSAPTEDLCDNMWGDRPSEVLANGAVEGVGRAGSKGAHLKMVFGPDAERNLSYWRYRLLDPIPIVEELKEISFWVKANVPVRLKIAIQPYGFIYHAAGSEGKGEWERVAL